MPKPYYQDESVTIYHGNSAELIQVLTADVLITDPPYGVMLGDTVNGQSRAKNQATYTQFADSPEYLRDVCIPIIKGAIARTSRAALFCGNRNLWLYPPADEVGCWYVPAATSRGKWGFNTSNIILYYGSSPRAGIGDFANSFSLQATSEKTIHPCAKPLKVMAWLVNKATKQGEIVIDPFCGTGGTLRAAKDLGHKVIGIDIEERYCEIAARRMAQEVLPLEYK